MNLPQSRFSPHDEAVLVDPYPVYAHFREHDPVHWGEPYMPGASGCWYLFRHEDVVALLKDRRFVRKWPAGAATARIVAAPQDQRPYLEVLDRLLLSMDPPDHRRLRQLVNKAFTPQMVDSYRPLVQATADELIDGLHLPGFDVIEDFCAPLSFSVVSTILGVAREDAHRLRAWVEDFAGGLDLRKGKDAMAAAATATCHMLRYFSALVDHRHGNPRADLVSSLIAARDNEDRLSEDELLAMCIQLLFAGYETTVNQIGTSVLNLLESDDQRALLLRRPELIEGVVNESARLNGSVQSAAARKPIEDAMIGGQFIKAGDPVIAFIGSANRDPTVFPDPDRFDILRDNAASSVAFGAGIHHCLGAMLARMESEIAVGTLVRQLPRLELLRDQPPRRRMNIVLPGLTHLAARAS